MLFISLLQYCMLCFCRPVKGVKLNNFYYSEKYIIILIIVIQLYNYIIPHRVDECTMAGWLLRNSPLSASADAKMWQDYISEC